MSWSFESYVEGLLPQERRLFLKRSALYAHAFGVRVFGAEDRIPVTSEAVLGITLTKIVEGCEGYAFKEGDILPYYYLCRCCRRTILSIFREEPPDEGNAEPLVEEEDDTPAVLTERAAVQFLERRQCLDEFLHFVRGKGLKGKLRAYAAGFAKYGSDAWDVARIAKDLRVLPATVGTYRSQLRGFLEEFELQRARGALA
jgi:hypothetical protein